MTDKAKELITIAWRGSVDLVLGTFTAQWVEKVMSLLKTEPTTFVDLLVRIFAQVTLTLWTGGESRGLLIDTNSFDPTGGIVFIASVFRQPTLWKNVDQAATEIHTWLSSILGKYTHNTLPDARPPTKLTKNNATGSQNTLTKYQ
jgi:hypothetical protein